jgi:hypothetical protein
MDYVDIIFAHRSDITGKGALAMKIAALTYGSLQFRWKR